MVTIRTESQVLPLARRPVPTRNNTSDPNIVVANNTQLINQVAGLIQEIQRTLQ